MAAGMISKPGSEYGPCLDEDCGHTDCAASRKIAATACALCDEPIGYERLFFQRENWTVLEHVACIEKAQNRKA